MGLHLKIPAGLWLVAVLALAACAPAAAPQAEEPALTPAASSTAASTPTMEAPLESPPSGALLEQAVQALRDAASFRLTAHVTTAYEGLDAAGGRVVVYREQIAQHSLIRTPDLKVHTCYQDRADAQADFAVTNTYAYQEGGRYYVIDVNEAGLASKNEVAYGQIEPLAGDVYQTLTRYAGQAEFQSESGGIAIYTLDHPAWYTLREAIRFAGMESLAGQPDSPERLRAYAAEVYPHAQPVRFVISVNVEQALITSVSVDERAFLQSIWEAQPVKTPGPDGEAAPQAGLQTLADPQLLEAHGAEYLFDSYAQVPDFEVPRVPT